MSDKVEVLVFKTTVRKRRNIRFVAPYLNRLIKPQGCWNFDLEDCDNILRVETTFANVDAIENTLKELGFFCSEL
ncbi:hypothetical protein [Flavobacterium sp. ASW18X]|uniref:hypothetical protein n=1 Tax=Flavobacterium sp. ASW18X TaxID=2572595 RepID=UPI0010ADF2C6|nr:hypothetical protein [Flavobacterium sp. ASW18X]TKD65006.1 hypothetical protein FBT53_05605 [Flavobacterium sp. ASW18X]